jgi:hypothetical protein
VFEDSLHQVAEAGPRGRPRRGQLLVDDDLEDGWQSLSPDLRRPGHGEEAGVVERPVPGRHPRPVLVVGRRSGQAGVVVLQPGAEPDAERDSSGESPKSIVAPHPVMAQHTTQVDAGIAADVAGEQGPAEEDVGQALPRVPDAPVHLNHGLAHGAGGPGAVRLRRRRRSQRVGCGSASTAQAA